MDNGINSWLEDIERSIDKIYDFLPEKRDCFTYQKDLKTKKAVERNIEIIGEAINRIAHEYDTISDEVIWTIIIKELPELKKEIGELRR